MEGVRNAAPRLAGRAIEGDYAQIPALVERSKLGVANFDGNFLIENGRIAGPQLRFNESLASMLGNIAAIGPSERSHGGLLGDVVISTPPLLVKEFTFSSKAAGIFSGQAESGWVSLWERFVHHAEVQTSNQLQLVPRNLLRALNALTAEAKS
jgi:hypothetical protein